MMRPGLTLGLLLLAAGCASGGGGSVSASTLGACTTQGAPEGWRQVQAEAFSFCVPGSWTSSGSRGWRGSGGSVEWGTGTGRRQIASTTTLVTAGPGGRLPTEAEVRAQLEREIRPVYRQTESVHGFQATLWITEVQGDFVTGADFQGGGGFQLSGEATDRSSADQQLDIYRTVRLSAKWPRPEPSSKH